MVLIFLIHFHILHPVHNFSCFLWSFAVLLHLLWNEDRLDSLSWSQDSKSGRFMVCTRLQQCFLPYYNIFLPLKAKGSLQGMVAMSLESPYQVLMITQSRVSFEYRWIFFLKSLPYSCSCGNVPPPSDLHLVFLTFFTSTSQEFSFPHAKKFSVICKLGDFTRYPLSYFIS